MESLDLIHLLIELGLNKKESKIYLTLLELEESLPSVISRRSGVKRPTTYVVLDQLKKKGIVSTLKKKDREYFRAVSPKLLLEEQKNKCVRLEKAIPHLLSLNERYGVTPQMSIYEGRDGLIQIMEDTLTTKTDLMCLCNSEMAEGILTDYYPMYVEKKVERKIFLKGVFNYGAAALRDKKTGKDELREVYLVPKEKFFIQNEINIYDDKVAIISHEDEIGVIIQNKAIADTQRAIFMMTFEYAKLLEPELLTEEDKQYLAS